MTIPIWNNKDRLMDCALFYTICAFSLFEEFEVRPYFYLPIENTQNVNLNVYIIETKLTKIHKCVKRLQFKRKVCNFVERWFKHFQEL